ncbi:MAG: FecR domain-containing protein [Reichenbachiella sp.]|uniref:FecR family protein n=1 Tax=Reichenbachiella sp. TaxID=2184521 RepID=UPI003297D64D
MEELLLKKLNGELLSTDEIIKLDAWIENDQKNRELFDQISLIWKYDQDKFDNARNEVWQRLQHNIGKSEHIIEDYAKENTGHKSRYFLSLSRIAAVFLLATTLALTLYIFSKNSVLSEEVVLIQKESLSGQKLTVILPDSTIVKLNANSKIIAPKEFSDDTREVTLIGEAFFDVKKNPIKPFVIHTENLDVEVLGTSFNVNSYPENQVFSVAVATGRVAVSNKGQSLKSELTPGEKITFQANSNKFSVAELDWDREFGWKDNKLVFKRENLNEILTRLARWYGFEIQSSIDIDKEKLFSGSYENPTIQAVLEGLSFVYQFEYEINKNKILIK